MTTTKETMGSDAWRKLRDVSLPHERMLGGVCSGLARATPLAAWMWRALFIATLVYWGVGIGVYLILMLAIPDEK